MQPLTFDLPSIQRPLARRDLLAQKIVLEHNAMLHGRSLIQRPPEYPHIPDQTREQRLADWERLLTEMDKELGNQA